MQTKPLAAVPEPVVRAHSLAALRDLGVALALLTLMTAAEAWRFGVDYAGHFRQVLTYGQGYTNQTGGPIALISIVGTFMLLLYFLWFSLQSTPRVRWIYFTIFAIAHLAEYSYQGAYNRFSSPENILMIFLFADASLYKDTLLGWLNWTALVPIALYAFVLITYRTSQRARLGRLLLIVALIGGFYSAMYQMWVGHPRGAPPTPALGNFFRTATFFPWKLAQSY
jgi:glucan phosphoethanolaminetransferase (alkaline phosphatase superfamily)